MFVKADGEILKFRMALYIWSDSITRTVGYS